MNSIENNPTRDPLFQLNMILWLAQPLPINASIKPLLYNKGFMVHAISPLLTVPPDVRIAAQEAQVVLQDVVCPDVVLSNEINRKYSIFECKASSFSPSSSTAKQARSLFVVSGSRAAEVLGLVSDQVSESLLIFGTRESERNRFEPSLNSLFSEIQAKRLPAGQFSILGFLFAGTDISVNTDNKGAMFFGIQAGINKLAEHEPDTDPRPLYFIPYDPDIDQSALERAFCKRILFERIHSTIISAVGRANPPFRFTLDSRSMLMDATFGMYGLWQKKESLKHMRWLCREFMQALSQAINAVFPDIIIYVPEQGWTISIRDQNEYEKALDAFASFSCETLDLSTVPQPTLFDEL